MPAVAQLWRSRAGILALAARLCTRLTATAQRSPCARPCPQEKQDKAVLQSEVASLRQNNQRLQEESQAASEQLRKFAEIFCREKKEL